MPRRLFILFFQFPFNQLPSFNVSPNIIQFISSARRKPTDLPVFVSSFPVVSSAPFGRKGETGPRSSFLLHVRSRFFLPSRFYFPFWETPLVLRDSFSLTQHSSSLLISSEEQYLPSSFRFARMKRARTISSRFSRIYDIIFY